MSESGKTNTIQPFKYGGMQKRAPPMKKGTETSVGAFAFQYVPFAQRNELPKLNI